MGVCIWNGIRILGWEDDDRSHARKWRLIFSRARMHMAKSERCITIFVAKYGVSSIQQYQTPLSKTNAIGA